MFASQGLAGKRDSETSEGGLSFDEVLLGQPHEPVSQPMSLQKMPPLPVQVWHALDTNGSRLLRGNATDDGIRASLIGERILKFQTRGSLL